MAQKIKERLEDVENRVIDLKQYALESKKYPECNIYEIPFSILDKTVGGGSYGRIVWCIEIIRGRKSEGRNYISKILIWSGQTRDKRVANKVFSLDVHSESLQIRNGDIYGIQPCSLHSKGTVITLYPKDVESNEDVLRISNTTSILLEVKFKEGK